GHATLGRVFKVAVVFRLDHRIPELRLVLRREGGGRRTRAGRAVVARLAEQAAVRLEADEVVAAAGEGDALGARRQAILQAWATGDVEAGQVRVTVGQLAVGRRFDDAGRRRWRRVQRSRWRWRRGLAKRRPLHQTA